MFLDETEQHGEQHDDRNDDGLERVTEESGYECRTEENQNEDVLELGREGVPRGHTGQRLQLVWPVDLKALCRLGAREACQPGGQVREHFVHRQGVPNRIVFGIAMVLLGRRLMP